MSTFVIAPSLMSPMPSSLYQLTHVDVISLLSKALRLRCLLLVECVVRWARSCT